MAGTTKFASASVRTMTPQVTNSSRSRWGNAAPEESVVGIVMAMESDTAPFGPDSVVTSVFRSVFLPVSKRLPVVLFAESQSEASSHTKRTASATKVTAITMRTREKTPFADSSMAGAAVEGSSAPSVMKMMPFNTNEMRLHTFSEAMPRRVENICAFLPLRASRRCRYENRSPAATTARMPLTCMCSATR